MKMKKREPMVKPADDANPVAPEETSEKKVSKNITCSYGIHRGNFPVAGLKVKDARAILKKLIKVSDDALAVIAGENVSEDDVIGEDVTLLSFVKPSAKKGSETISIEKETVKMDGKKVGVEEFCGLIAKNTASGLCNQPIPDNVKWIARSGHVEVYIVELKPELRMIKWIAKNSPVPYGSGATYSFRKLATPYVVMKATFVMGALQGNVELFYRSRPMESIEDKLCHTNLLNVSPGAYGCKAWFCTQYLDVSGMKGPADILTGVLNHVWGGGFNESSEAHEGNSGFSLSKKKKVDERVTDVDKWENESAKDPKFVLDVNWCKADTTPQELIKGDLKKFGGVEAPASSKAIGNILLASALLK